MGERHKRSIGKLGRIDLMFGGARQHVMVFFFLANTFHFTTISIYNLILLDCLILLQYLGTTNKLD